MKIYILRPKTETPLEGTFDPWEPWFDKAFGFVITAKNEENARKIADDSGGDESDKETRPWLDSKYSTCVELTAGNKEELVIRDFASA